MKDEINNKASLVLQKLHNTETVITLIGKMQNSLSSDLSLNQKCDILNGLGIMYYLYPEVFKEKTEEEMQVVRNPILRFHFLTGISISDIESINDFNYYIDDKNIYVINSEIFENTNFPFLMSYNEETWLIQSIRPGSVYFYTISKDKDIWKISNHKHGHNPFKFENHLISILGDILKLA